MTTTTQTTRTVPVQTPWRQHGLLYLVFFLIGAQMFVVSPMLADVSTDLGEPPSAAAMIITAYVLGYALVSPVLGALADNRSRRRVILLGGTIFGIADLVCALGPSLPIIVVAHGVTGVGGALAGPAIWAYFGETAAPHQVGRAIGRGTAAFASGQILGVPLGTFVAGAASWRWSFAALGACMLATMLLLAFRLRDPDRPRPAERSATQALRASAALWRRPEFVLIIVMTTLAQASRMGAYSFVGLLFGRRFGLGVTQLGLVGAVAGVGALLGSFVAGPLVDRWRRSGWSIASISVGAGTVLAVAMGVALTASHVQVALAGLVVWFAAGGTLFGATQAQLATRFPRQRGSVVSWNNSASNLGVAVGTTVLGAFVPGVAGFVIMACGLAVASTLAAAALWRAQARGGRGRAREAG
ncbi:MFS transporter [Naumannella huperziae]